MSLNRAYALAKFEQIDPTIDLKNRVKASISVDVDNKAIATSQKDLLNFALENKQDDLLYFKATYATCGFNLNDDVFINNEFWNARKSPVLKSINWQHVDKDIIGVIYAVEAQYLDGTQIDIESNEIPKDDFELVVYGVVYKYTFVELAKEIENRSKAGKLYVSMEAWFADFSYALLDESNQTMKVVARTEQTKILDKYLKVLGGSGQYNGKRIGRVLKDMTFGGMGIVNEPANPRSNDGEVIASITEIKMADNSNKVEEVVDAAEKVKELETTVASLKTEASENVARLEAKLKEETEAKTVANGVIEAIQKHLDTAIAGVGTTPPPEVAKIDAAQTADAKFAAMLSWLSATASKAIATNATLQAEVDALKAKVTKFEDDAAAAVKAAKVAARTVEIKELLGADASVEDVAKLVKGLAELEDEAYKTRIEELKIVAAKSRPTVRHDGAQGSPDAEGASGEGKATNGPRADRKVTAATALENAIVEPSALESGNVIVNNDNPFASLAKVVLSKNKE